MKAYRSLLLMILKWIADLRQFALNSIKECNPRGSPADNEGVGIHPHHRCRDFDLQILRDAMTYRSNDTRLPRPLRSLC
jgi:hypothetical protein